MTPNKSAAPEIKNPLLPRISFRETVFIIDNISTAYAVAIIAKGRSIHCIYECKEITWRKADYVKLFDLILSDVTFLSREVVYVPHPYLRPNRNLLAKIVSQKKFARKVRRLYTLDPKRTYVSSSVSSLLIANRRYINAILVDEGMGSVVARNRVAFRGNRLIERLKAAISSWVLSFQFPNNIPQITLTNDPHSSILGALDYRDFDSHQFKLSVERLNKLIDNHQCNILVLLKGPSPNAQGHHSEGDQYGEEYSNFNLQAIASFLHLLPQDVVPALYLKSHPSLGRSGESLRPLVNSLNEITKIAIDVSDYIDFEEASSLPAEGLIRYLKFNYLLALDATSCIWNVAYRGAIKCFLPINNIIEFSKAEGGHHTELYELQKKINSLMGNDVSYFDVKIDIR